MITTTSSNDLQFDEIESIGLYEMILSDLNQGSPLLYHDLYEVLLRYGIEGDEVVNLECDMAEILFNPDKTQFLQEYLREIIPKNKTRLKCLIYRGLGRSWEAAKIAQELRLSEPDTYKDIIQGIARDLQNRKLTFEADRLLSFYNFPPHHEYKGLLKKMLDAPPDSSNSLVSLLKNWVESKLKP